MLQRLMPQSSPARWLLWATLCACSTEGPLLVRRADAGRPVMSLQYQITGTLDASVEAELFVVDLFATSAAQVAALHAQERVVMAYVSVGSLEPWRDDADSVPRAAIGKPLASYPDESWLDTRSEATRQLATDRFERAVEKGFDGVYASSVGAYRADSGFALTSSDELAFLSYLVQQAHTRGLRIGLSGEFALAGKLEFDFAIAQGCVAQDTCDALAPWIARGVPSFDLEVTGDPESVCRDTKGVVVIFKRSSYDAYRSVCP